MYGEISLSYIETSSGHYNLIYIYIMYTQHTPIYPDIRPIYIKHTLLSAEYIYSRSEESHSKQKGIKTEFR